MGLQLPWLGAEWETRGKVINDANCHQLSCFLQLFPLVTPKKSGVPQQESAKMGFWGNQIVNQLPRLNLLTKPSGFEFGDPNWRGRGICQPNSSPLTLPQLPVYTLRRQGEDQLMPLLPARLLMGMLLTKLPLGPEKPCRPI